MFRGRENKIGALCLALVPCLAGTQESSYMALFRVRRVLATQVLLVPTSSIPQLHSSIKLALLRLLTEGFICENSNLLRDSHLIYVGVFI